MGRVGLTTWSERQQRGEAPGPVHGEGVEMAPSSAAPTWRDACHIGWATGDPRNHYFEYLKAQVVPNLYTLSRASFCTSKEQIEI